MNLGIAGFVDVETTGLNPNYDEIIELSLCLFEYNKETGEIIRIVDKYLGLREPNVPISRGAQMVNNISYEELMGKSLDIEIIESLIDKSDFLIAHNAKFDYSFLSRIVSSCIQKTWLCSIRNIDWKRKGFKSRSLPKLLADHGIQPKRSHRAEDDVLAAIELLSWEEHNGKTYLFELIQALLKR